TRATNESTNACVPSARRSTASTVKTQSVRPGQPRPGLSIAVRCPTMAATGQGRASARINIAGRGETNVATGVPVLDHLLSALHVRLVEGRDTQHVLEAIFKALGVALAQACRPRRRAGE